MNRIISILLAVVLVLNPLPAFAEATDSSLAERIETLKSENSTVAAEKSGLNEKYLKLLRDQPMINQSIYQVRRAAGGNAIVLTVRLIVESVGLMTADWKEIADKYREALSGDDDNIYYMRSNEEYANALRGDLLLIADLEANLANNKNKLTRINSRIAEIDSKLSGNNTEISRLKELYRQAAGEEYSAEGSVRRVDTAALSSTYNYSNYGDSATSGRSETEGFGMAMGAALSGYEQAQKAKVNYINQGYTLTSPELIWTNDFGDIYIYQSLLLGKPWDGTYEDAVGRYDSGNATRILYTVAKNSAGRFFLSGYRDELPYNTAPELDINFDARFLARGFSVQLHADLNDAEGDEVQVTWFLETANGHPRIGQGNDFQWSVPASQETGYIAAVAVDSKGGISYRRSNYNIQDTYSFYDVTISTIPAVLEAGAPALLVTDIRTSIPGEYRVNWSYGPNYMSNSAYTIQAIENADFIRILSSGNYIYRSFLPIDPKAYTDSGELIYSYQVKAKAEGGAGGAVYGTSYEYSQDIMLGEAHIIKDQQKALEDAAAVVNAKKLEYDKLYNSYKDQMSSMGVYAYGSHVDLHSLTVRSKQYADWRLGLAEADTAWGENYTYSLFKSTSEECLAAVKELCRKLGLSYGTDLDVAMGEPASGYNWDDMFKYRLQVIAAYIPQLKTQLDRQQALSEAYTKASRAREELGDLAAKADKTKLNFDIDALLWPSEPAAAVGAESYSQLDNYLTLINSDIGRIPAKGGFAPATQVAVVDQPANTIQDKGTKIEVNGSLISPDVAPRIVGGRTMVPVRFIAQALNCLVDWRASDNTVIITSNGKYQVNPPVKDKTLKIYVDGQLVTPDVPPQIIDSRTMVPIRFVAQALNAEVDWNDVTRTVIIRTK